MDSTGAGPGRLLRAPGGCWRPLQPAGGALRLEPHLLARRRTFQSGREGTRGSGWGEEKREKRGLLAGKNTPNPTHSNPSGPPGAVLWGSGRSECCGGMWGERRPRGGRAGRTGWSAGSGPGWRGRSGVSAGCSLSAGEGSVVPGFAAIVRPARGAMCPRERAGPGASCAGFSGGRWGGFRAVVFDLIPFRQSACP